MSVAKRVGRALLISGVLGSVAFWLSGWNNLSWILAAGIFYYDFAIRETEQAPPVLKKRSRK